MQEPSYLGMPRWVKAFAAGAIVLLLLLVILRTSGIGGDHGPDRHMGSVAPDPAQPAHGSEMPVENHHDQGRGGH